MHTNTFRTINCSKARVTPFKFSLTLFLLISSCSNNDTYFHFQWNCKLSWWKYYITVYNIFVQYATNEIIILQFQFETEFKLWFMSYLLFHTHILPFTPSLLFSACLLYFIGTEAYGIIMSMYASPIKFRISWQMLIKHATRM
jgi:hypothetical protein